MVGAFPKLKKHVNWKSGLSVLIGAICAWGGAQLGLEETVTGAVCGALCSLIAKPKPAESVVSGEIDVD